MTSGCPVAVMLPTGSEARRAAVSLLKDLESDGSLPADERRRTEKVIQDLTDEKVKKLDEMTEQKEEEILQV